MDPPALPEKADLAFPGGILSPLSSIGQQLTKLSNTALIQAQQVNKEQLPLIQDRKTTVSSSLTGKMPIITDIVAKTIQIIYTISNCQKLLSRTYSKILSILWHNFNITLITLAIAEGGDFI